MKHFSGLLVVAFGLMAMTFITTSCSKSKKIDVERILQVMDKPNSEITESDVDFILDQIEIIVDKTKGMTKEESEAYCRSIDKDNSGVVIALAIMSQGYHMSGKLTEKQQARYDELVKRSKGK